MRVGVLTGGGDCRGVNGVMGEVVWEGVTTGGFELVGL